MDISRKSNKDNDSFYKELDEKKAHNSCCTCQSLLILLFLMLIFSTGILFYLYFVSTKGGFFPFSNSNSSDVLKRIENINQNKIEPLVIEISENDLDEILNSVPLSGNLLLKNIKSDITSENIFLYGNLIKPISSKITITVKPKAKNGEVFFEINKLTLGDLKLFNLLSNTFSDNLSNLFNTQMKEVYNNYTVEKIELLDGKMIIYGKLKNKGEKND